MARHYLFSQPQRLPLTTAELSATPVLPLQDAAAVQAALARMVPGLSWDGPEGRGKVDGNWLAFSPPAPGGTLGLRCSLRADHRAFLQRLCDTPGWLAVDERPLCSQPPLPA